MNALDVLITSMRLAGEGGHRRFKASIMLSRSSVSVRWSMSAPQPRCINV